MDRYKTSGNIVVFVHSATHAWYLEIKSCELKHTKKLCRTQHTLFHARQIKTILFWDKGGDYCFTQRISSSDILGGCPSVAKGSAVRKWITWVYAHYSVDTHVGKQAGLK